MERVERQGTWARGGGIEREKKEEVYFILIRNSYF